MLTLTLATVVAAAPRRVLKVQPVVVDSRFFSRDFTGELGTLSAPLQLIAWTQLNCKGDFGVTQFTDSVLARNISNGYVSRSFQLNRTLTHQEQLDISVTDNFTSWYSNKDQLSYESSSCSSFWQTYYAMNGSTSCYNTPPFTCHRLWNNPGLPMN
ncbi:hypothetical protein N7460_012219 [Penicillium canescens]|uniref:Uncharacterized protein n=1 Tax=Penicillium canescens TaxID=5083 RepID=A0AAD6N3T4_PENCN|nr:hypothetical protein N7460_012219 [Penicillium canescens]